MNVRQELSVLAALAATALASPALAQISDDVVKIGVLTDMNGPASTPAAQGSVTAAECAKRRPQMRNCASGNLEISGFGAFAPPRK